MIHKHLDVQIDDIVNLEQYNLLTNEEFNIIENMEEMLKNTGEFLTMKNLKVTSTESLSHINFIKDYLVNRTIQ